VGKVTTGLTVIFKNAPRYLVVFLARPFIRILSPGSIKERELTDKIRSVMGTASIPIGISAAFAALFFVGLFLLR